MKKSLALAKKSANFVKLWLLSHCVFVRLIGKIVHFENQLQENDRFLSFIGKIIICFIKSTTAYHVNLSEHIFNYLCIFEPNFIIQL